MELNYYAYFYAKASLHLYGNYLYVVTSLIQLVASNAVGRIASTVALEEEMFSVQTVLPQRLIPAGMVAMAEVARVQHTLRLGLLCQQLVIQYPVGSALSVVIHHTLQMFVRTAVTDLSHWSYLYAYFYLLES